MTLSRMIVALAGEADDRFATWDRVAALAPELFAAGALEIRLAYFGREGRLQTRPFIAAHWVAGADDLVDLMDRARSNCVCGCFVQIGDILEHALREPKPLQAVVIIGDCFHGDLQAALAAARKLRDPGPRFFLVAQERSAADSFHALAAAGGGACVELGSPQIERIAERLPGTLEAVAHFAVGGEAALERHGGECAGLLLDQVTRRIGQRRP